MGSGKSTIGAILATNLVRTYIDNDTTLEEMTGRTRDELGAISITELHKIEDAFIDELLRTEGAWIAGAPGSVVDNPINLEKIQKVFCVYLYRPLTELFLGTRTSGVGRQGLSENKEQVIRERFELRDPLYRACADLTITLSHSPEIDAQRIIAQL